MTCTWNPSDKTAGITLSNGDLTAEESSGSYQAVRATTSQTTGKFYFEITVLYTLSGQELVFGVSTLVDAISANWYGNNYNAVARQTPVAGTVYGVAYDCATGKMWYSSNGTWVGDPAAGTGETETNSGGLGSAVAPYFASDNTTSSPHGVTANFGATAFAYTPPAGFDPWDTSSPSTLSITSITPDQGPATGGTGCTITGTGFTETTTVEFGGIPADGVIFSSSTELLCTTPQGPNAPYGGAVDVTVIDGAASDTLTNGYTYTLVLSDYDLFMDGFDYYATAHIGMKWPSSGDMEILPASGRRGGGCLSPSAAGAFITSPTIIGTSGLTVGFALMRKTTDVFSVTINTNGGSALYCDVLADGSVEMTADTTDALACSISLDAWVYVEITAIYGTGTFDGTFKLYSTNPCGGSALIFDGSYSVETTYTSQPDSFSISGELGNWIIDDLYMRTGTTGFGNVQVDAIEADSVVSNGFDTWSPSDGLSTLDACVNATDASESLLICNPGGDNGPNKVLLGYSTTTPATIHGTQINAWMSMDAGVTVYSPALQIGDNSDFYYYTPPSSDMTGISVGKVGTQPDSFGYDGNE